MRQAALLFCLAVVIVSVVGVVAALAQVSALNSQPLTDAAGGYDIGRANAVTHAYLQAVLVAVIGLAWLVVACALALWPRRSF